MQAGPVVSVHMPRDKVTGLHVGYGFVELRTEEDAEYVIKVCVYSTIICGRYDGLVTTTALLYPL